MIPGSSECHIEESFFLLQMIQLTLLFESPKGQAGIPGRLTGWLNHACETDGFIQHPGLMEALAIEWRVQAGDGHHGKLQPFAFVDGQHGYR